MRIKGSLPYYLQGHNFSFSRKDYVEGVKILQAMLGVPLWNATIEEFEFGCIIPVEKDPASYIRNHYASSKAHLGVNEKGKDKGAFRWWDDSGRALKMYDAGKNIKMKQDMKAREVIIGAGYNPEKNYLKFEVHHKRPHLLNGGRIVCVEDLQNPAFLHHLSEELIEHYKLLVPMKTLLQPESKKDLSALDIAVSMYVENLLNQGIPVEDAKKKIYSFINHQEILSKPDKDSRKATFRRTFDKLRESADSQWDLTKKIESALAQEQMEG